MDPSNAEMNSTLEEGLAKPYNDATGIEKSNGRRGQCSKGTATVEQGSTASLTDE
jgi:hypothetical protein